VNSSSDNPFWSHLPHCADCQALTNAYREFLNPVAEDELSFNVNEADDELVARLDSAFDPSSKKDVPSKIIFDIAHWWTRKEFWYSSAAIMVVGVGLFVGQELVGYSDPGFGGDSGFVRGDETIADEFFCTRMGDFLQVTWPEYPDADQVRIILYDGDMAELEKFTNQVAGPLLISSSKLTGLAAYGQVLYLAHDDVLQRGPLFSIPPAP